MIFSLSGLRYRVLMRSRRTLPWCRTHVRPNRRLGILLLLSLALAAGVADFDGNADGIAVDGSHGVVSGSLTAVMLAVTTPVFEEPAAKAFRNVQTLRLRTDVRDATLLLSAFRGGVE